MGSLSDYAENKILDHSVGKTSWTMPATPFLALWTTAPNDASTGAAPSPGVEVTGGSYARKSYVGADWNAASAGSISNANDIVFVTATGSWGTVVAVSIMDASTSGNFIWWGALTANKTVATGDVFKFLAGQLVLTLD